MNYEIIRYRIAAKLSLECTKHFGFAPSIYDITNKLSHLHRVNNPAPVNMKDMKEHIIKTVSNYCRLNKSRVTSAIISTEIARMKSYPSKPLPLP